LLIGTMRHLLATLFTAYAVVVRLGEGISVPTGKETPITPAKPTVRPPPPAHPRAPAPVHEYTQDNPEPPPLDPSYKPPTYKYLNGLAPKSINYVPLRIRNIPSYNDPNSVESETPRQPIIIVIPIRDIDYNFPTDYAQHAAYREPQVYQQPPQEQVYQPSHNYQAQSYQPQYQQHNYEQYNYNQQQNDYQQQQPKTYQQEQRNNYQQSNYQEPSNYQQDQTNYQPARTDNQQTYETKPADAYKPIYNKPSYFLPKASYGKDTQEVKETQTKEFGARLPSKGGYPKKASGTTTGKYSNYNL